MIAKNMPSEEAKMLAFAALRCAQKTNIENAIVELEQLCYTPQELQIQRRNLEEFDHHLTHSSISATEETHKHEHIPLNQST